jgi:hypothetical protein
LNEAEFLGTVELRNTQGGPASGSTVQRTVCSRQEGSRALYTHIYPAGEGDTPPTPP